MKKCFVLTIISFFIILCGGSSYAATFKITPSKTKVNPNESFSVSVGGDCIGRVNLSVQNGSLSSSSVWVEQNYQTVNVKAGSSGTVTITATPAAGFSDADANEYKPGAKSTKVIIAVPSNTQSVPDKTNTNKPTASKPSDEPVTNNSQTTTKPNTNTNNSNKQDKVTNTNSKPIENNSEVEEKSSNNLLSSLSTNVGTLVPEFDMNTSEYSLDLSNDIETVTINAGSADSKSLVNGLGDIKVVPGDNLITVTVVAENGAEKIYTIKAYVDETPQVYVKYKDEEIGVARNLKDIAIPEGFNEKQHKVNEYVISIFGNEHFSIICGIDSENVKNLYTFDIEKNECISKIIPITIDNHFFYLVDLEEKEGFEQTSITINDKEVSAYKFKNGFENYFLLSVINSNGEKLEYLYETNEKTIQLYLNSAPISYNEYQELIKEVKTKQIIIYILSAFLLASIICIIILFFKSRKGETDEKVH